MRRPKLSNPLLTLAILFGVFGSILLQGILLYYYCHLRLRVEFVSASVVLIIPNSLLWWLTYVVYRRYRLRPLSGSSSLLGFGCIIFIGLAGAILAPIFAAAHGKAPQSQCNSNMKHIAMGLRMYAEDWDEKLPSAPTWAAQTSVYVKQSADGSVWHCSEATAPYSYAMNRPLAGCSTTDVDEWASTLLLLESDAVTWNVVGGKESLPKPGRHNGGGIYAFLDSHTKYMRDDAARTHL